MPRSPYEPTCTGVTARSDAAARFGFRDVLGTRPAALLARDILDRQDRPGLRALVVLGGDPAASLPDTESAARALAALDCLVVVDLFEGRTARYAHALLPAAMVTTPDENGPVHARDAGQPLAAAARAGLALTGLTQEGDAGDGGTVA